MATTGKSTVAGTDVDLNLNLTDVFKSLNGALSGRAEAWRGDFGIATEIYYVSIGGDSSVNVPNPSGGNVGVDVTVKQFFVDLVGSYRIHQGTYSRDDYRYSVDVFAGARYNVSRSRRQSQSRPQYRSW